VTNTAHNLIVLGEAQRTIENFERTYGISTAEMLSAVENDERLAGIDGFELMDWHFAVDQKEALVRMIESTHPGERERQYSFSCQYHLASTGVLVNATERELDLVA
jgi:hypothetical protein